MLKPPFHFFSFADKELDPGLLDRVLAWHSGQGRIQYEEWDWYPKHVVTLVAEARFIVRPSPDYEYRATKLFRSACKTFDPLLASLQVEISFPSFREFILDPAFPFEFLQLYLSRRLFDEGCPATGEVLGAGWMISEHVDRDGLRRILRRKFRRTYEDQGISFDLP